MSFRPRTDRAVQALAASVALATLLGACSDLYYDRRETIALGADDAVAANLVAQMVDPWPRYSNNKNLAFNGERMQMAAERYRTDKVKEARGIGTSSVKYEPVAISAGK
jgi:hypothetical protein